MAPGRPAAPTPAGALALARRLVDGARAGRPDLEAGERLVSLDQAALAAALSEDAARIAFWLNVYNAAVRARLLSDPTAYRRRWRFFAAPAVTIAGRSLSPNAIEHGILRRSALALGLGCLRNPFPSRYERRMRVRRVDPRIHFALNCGARSCPPLAAWDPATLDDDLERATRAYLEAESSRSVDGGVVHVPRLLLWYRGDFGGRQGVLSLLRRHRIVGTGEEPALRYGDYDWTLDVGGPTGDP